MPGRRPRYCGRSRRRRGPSWAIRRRRRRPGRRPAQQRSPPAAMTLIGRWRAKPRRSITAFPYRTRGVRCILRPRGIGPHRGAPGSPLRRSPRLSALGHPDSLPALLGRDRLSPPGNGRTRPRTLSALRAGSVGAACNEPQVDARGPRHPGRSHQCAVQRGAVLRAHDPHPPSPADRGRPSGPKRPSMRKGPVPSRVLSDLQNSWWKSFSGPGRHCPGVRKRSPNSFSERSRR